MLFASVFLLMCAVRANAIPLDCNNLTKQIASRDVVAVNHLIQAVAQLLCKNKDYGTQIQETPTAVATASATQIGEGPSVSSAAASAQVGPTQAVASADTTTCDANTQSGNYCPDGTNTVVVEEPPQAPEFYATGEDALTSPLASDQHNENPVVAPIGGNNQPNSSGDVSSCLCPPNKVPVPIVTIECKNQEEVHGYPPVSLNV